MLMRQLHILCVEDEPSNAEIIEIALTSQGHRVTNVENGQQAVEVLVEQGLEVDAVFMDIQLPVLDGLAAIRAIRAHARTQALPIICVSARASGSDGQAGVAAGCDAYITKPYKARQLLEVLRDTLVAKGLLSPEEPIIRS